MNTDGRQDPMRQSYLVTGAAGCIGAWVVKMLLDGGRTVLALDASDDDSRLRTALGGDLDRPGLTRLRGDITDADTLQARMRMHEVDAVIHLAALQVPAVARRPVLGAQVNVVGTAVVLDAMAARGITAPLAYASSVAAYESGGSGLEADIGRLGHPATLYGVFKRANEGMASVYAADHGVASIGLRPYVVYGPGRDVGLTSQPTAAMAAAARGQGYHIGYGGRSQMQYVQDVAQAFVNVTKSEFRGATVSNLGGPSVHMAQVVAAIEHVVPEVTGRITFDPTPLPFPEEVESRAGDHFEVPAWTDLTDGVARTIATFRASPTTD